MRSNRISTSWLGRLFGWSAAADETKAVEFSSDLMAAILTGSWGGPSKSGASVSTGTALQCPAFWRGINVIANGIRQLPVEIYRPAADGRGVEPATDHPLYYLLRHKANGLLCAADYWGTVLLHAAATGHHVSYRNTLSGGKTVELIPVRPDWMHIEVQPDFSLRYHVTFENGSSATLSQDQVFHVRGPSWDGTDGLSPVDIGREAIGLAMVTEETHARFHANGARPSGVLQTDAKVDDSVLERLRAMFAERYAGTANAAKPMILQGGLKWQQVQMTGVDSQHLECCVAGTLVSMADGTRKRVEHLAVGDAIVAWDENNDCPVAAAVSAVGRPPVKPRVRIKTARGRVLTTTDDHPYFGLKALRTPGRRAKTETPSWIKARDISVGNYVRIGLGVAPQVFSPEVSLDEAWFLGLMVGDGYIRNGGCSLSATDRGVISKATEVVRSLGGTLVQSASRPCDWVINSGGTNSKIGAPRALFRRAELEGCGASEKRVPQIVLRSGPEAWRAFLAGYLDADGTVTKAGAKTPHLSWSSINRCLLDDCQHMLAMLGIQSAIYSAAPGRRRVVMGMPCDAKETWALCIYGSSQIRAAARLLTPAHAEKRSRLAAFSGAAESRYRKENFDFDRVVQVECLGDGETVGVEIAGVHTHITNGIVTHNTRKHQVAEIARLLGLWPIMLGLGGDESPTFASAEAFMAMHVRYSLQPWLTSLKGAIETQLLTDEEVRAGYHVRIDTSELVRGSLAERTAYYKAALGTASSPGWLTQNEIREDDGWNPLDNPEADGVPPPPVNAPKPAPAETIDALPPDQAKASTPRTLYVSRRLLNADEFLRWARAQGFTQTLAAADLHAPSPIAKRASIG